MTKVEALQRARAAKAAKELPMRLRGSGQRFKGSVMMSVGHG